MPEAKTALCVSALQPETVIFCEASAAFAKVMTVPDSLDASTDACRTQEPPPGGVLCLGGGMQGADGRLRHGEKRRKPSPDAASAGRPSRRSCGPWQSCAPPCRKGQADGDRQAQKRRTYVVASPAARQTSCLAAFAWASVGEVAEDQRHGPRRGCDRVPAPVLGAPDRAVPVAVAEDAVVPASGPECVPVGAVQQDGAEAVPCTIEGQACAPRVQMQAGHVRAGAGGKRPS